MGVLSSSRRSGRHTSGCMLMTPMAAVGVVSALDTSSSLALLLPPATARMATAPEASDGCRGARATRMRVSRAGTRVLPTDRHSVSSHPVERAQRRPRLSRSCSCASSGSGSSISFIAGRRKRALRPPPLGALSSSAHADEPEVSAVSGSATASTVRRRSKKPQQASASDMIAALAEPTEAAAEAPRTPTTAAEIERGEGGPSAGAHEEEGRGPPSLWDDSEVEWRGAPRAESGALYELNMQLAAYAKDAQWEQALTLLRQALARSSSTNRSSFANGSVEDEAEGEEKGSARAAASAAVAGAPPIAAVEPNVVSYNNVITACANAKKQKRAEGIFREMSKERRLRPNVFTYGAVISACAKRGNWEDSVNYLEVRCILLYAVVLVVEGYVCMTYLYREIL